MLVTTLSTHKCMFCYVNLRDGVWYMFRLSCTQFLDLHCQFWILQTFFCLLYKHWNLIRYKRIYTTVFVFVVIYLTWNILILEDVKFPVTIISLFFGCITLFYRHSVVGNSLIIGLIYFLRMLNCYFSIY